MTRRKTLPSWIRIDAGFFSDPKIVGVGLVGWSSYFALLVINGRERANGRLSRASVTPRAIARMTGLSEEFGKSAVGRVEEALADCESAGLIAIGDDEIEICGWERWRPPSDPGATERQRRRRERAKSARDGVTGGHGDVTGDHDLSHAVTTTDQDIDQDPLTSDEARGGASEHREKRIDELVDLLWDEWVKLRNERGKRGVGMSKKTIAVWRSRARARLVDNGVKAEAIDVRYQEARRTLPMPLDDPWLIKSRNSLPYIFSDAPKFDKWSRAGESQTAGIAERFGQEPARMSQLVIGGEP